MVFERMAQRHWAKYLPSLTRGLKKAGTWESETREAAERAKETLAHLVNGGAQMQAAREWVLNEYILLPPETTE
jgi:hypothetical protein